MKTNADFKLRIDKYTDGDFSEINIQYIRNMPPTGFPHCDFIECGYFVHAVAKTNRLYDDIVVKLPIIIQHGDQEDWDQDQKQKEPNEEAKECKTKSLILTES